MYIDRRSRLAARPVPSDVVRRLVAAFRRWRRRARCIAELQALDDKTLADIGLHRSEIRSAVIEAEQSERLERRRCR